jgi:hypothetical protein
VIRGPENILAALVSSSGYYFEPKLISVQPTFPEGYQYVNLFSLTWEGSMLILVQGIARLSLTSKRSQSEMDLEGLTLRLRS